MRIVGGKYKGRIFKPNKKFSARPTTDIAKEGLFIKPPGKSRKNF